MAKVDRALEKYLSGDKFDEGNDEETDEEEENIPLPKRKIENETSHQMNKSDSVVIIDEQTTDVSQRVVNTPNEQNVFISILKKCIHPNDAEINNNEKIPYLAISGIDLIELMEKHEINDIFLLEDNFFPQEICRVILKQNQMSHLSQKFVQRRIVQIEEEKKEPWLQMGANLEYPRPFVKSYEATAVRNFLKDSTIASKTFNFIRAKDSKDFQNAHEYNFQNGYSVVKETQETKKVGSKTPDQTKTWLVTLNKADIYKKDYLNKLEQEFSSLKSYLNNFHLSTNAKDNSIAKPDLLESFCSKLLWAQSNSLESAKKPFIIIKACDLFNILNSFDHFIYIDDILKRQNDGFSKAICENIISFECKKLFKTHLEERLNQIITLLGESWIKKSFNGHIAFPYAKVDSGPCTSQVLNFLKGEKKEMNFDVDIKPISRANQGNPQISFIDYHETNKTYSVKGERISDKQVMHEYLNVA